MGAYIYTVKNCINGRAYIGSTLSPARRWNEHRRKLVANCHNNCHLQSAWNKYGEDAFEFMLLEPVNDVDLLIEREQHWLDACKANGGAYNFGDCVKAPWSGEHHTEEARRRISGARKGKRFTDEHRRKISIALIGRHHTEETRRKIGIGNKGKHVTNETRRKISVAHKGKSLTNEHKQKLSIAHAKPYPSFIDSNGDTHSAGINLTAFCSKHDLNQGTMCEIVKGKRKHHKGWRLA